MTTQPSPEYVVRPLFTAFHGSRIIARGDETEVSRLLACRLDDDREGVVLIFNDRTGAQIELDSFETPLTSPAADGVRTDTPAPTSDAEPEPPRRSPGRPKLGVVGREVTLLPRHWEWLSAQPGGASVALRKLVDRARRDNASRDRARGAQEAAFRFMSAIAGNEPGFEEASRSLFAGDAEAFDRHTAAWAADVREYARRLAAGAFEKQ